MSASLSVLAIHPGALGDVLQAVPALRALGDRVTLCAQPRLGALLAGAGVVARAVSFDGFGLDALFADGAISHALAERLRPFDRVVSWFGSRDEGYCRRLGALAPGAVVAPPVPAADGATVWRHLLATIGADSADRAPITLPDAWRDEARGALDALGVPRDAPFVLVHPGAGGRWKLASPAMLAEIATRAASGLRVVVHAGPADADAVDGFTRALARPLHVLREPTLPLLAGALAAARGYLGGDSGVSHLAAAVGAPAVVLFPEATRERWRPWSPTARAVAMEDAAAAIDAAAAALGAAISASRRSCP